MEIPFAVCARSVLIKHWYSMQKREWMWNLTFSNVLCLNADFYNKRRNTPSFSSNCFLSILLFCMLFRRIPWTNILYYCLCTQETYLSICIRIRYSYNVRVMFTKGPEKIAVSFLLTFVSRKFIRTIYWITQHLIIFASVLVYRTIFAQHNLIIKIVESHIVVIFNDFFPFFRMHRCTK